MAQKVLEYTINLTNKAQVTALQAAYPGGIHLAPDDAASAYLAPKQLVGTVFSAPSVRSPYFVVAGSGNYPTNVASFSRKSGGWFGLSFLFGTTTVFKWVGIFAYSANGTPEINGTPTEVVAIAQRKWICGFELPQLGDLPNTGTSIMNVSRGASRHVDGYGWSMRSLGNNVVANTNALLVATSNKTWERFYFRPMLAPTGAPLRIWKCLNSAGANPGASLAFSADRRLIINDVDVLGNEIPMATTSDQFEIGTWYRVDMLLEMKNPGGNLRLYINRKLNQTVTFPAGVGFSLTGNHSNSILGGFTGGSAPIEIDFDDWMGAFWPSVDSHGAFVGIDWLNGSKIQGIRMKGLGTGNAYTGDYRVVNPQVGETQTQASMVSSTAGASLSLLVDDKPFNQLGAIGAINFMVAIFAKPTGPVGSTGTLGWNFNGLTDLAALDPVQTGNQYTWHRRFYNPAGLTAPIANLLPLELRHIKNGQVGGQEDVNNAAVIAELVGTFGDEDVPADEVAQPDTYPVRNGPHMAPYPSTAWARSKTAPIAPVIVHSGTYTGNGTVTELQFRTAPTWLMIRRQTGAAAGYGSFWFSSELALHQAGQQGMNYLTALVDPSYAPTGVEDTQEQRFLVRISGTATPLNANGDTYNYVAVCDPGQRFHTNGVFHHKATLGNNIVNALRSSVFTPLYTFLQRYRIIGDATIGLLVRGPGHTGANGSQISTSESTLVATTAAGQIISSGTLHIDDGPCAYSAWRQDDNSSDPNKGKVVKIGTYTGDGAASRTVGLSPTGLRPLYAIVTPHNAQSIHRSPSHTTTQSSLMSGGGETNTGITAGGIDSFTVGITLNALGVIYEYFVLLGSATAGNGGWSIDGEFSYVDPAGDNDGYLPDTSLEPIVTVPTDPDPDPGTDVGNDCDAGDVCVAATTRIVNLALLEIGVSKILDNFCTQNTNEAVVARELYEQCVRHTLIVYPWPFATQYAVLSKTIAQPANADWLYSYRMPADCIFPRRIVVARGTAIDPQPPPMGLSSDASGGIILSNENNAVLEYTARPNCVGYNGDDLFIEALKWRLAAALCAPLTRMAGEADRCLKMFELVVQKAEATIKQGQPGLRGAASTVDTTPAAIAANVQVVNLALVRIGAKTIANLTTEQSREAVAANLVFEDVLRQVLRAFPWAFATQYLDPMTLVDGAAGDPVNADWTFAHRLPADVVFVRRLAVPGVGRSFDPAPDPFRVGADATGGLLYSNVEDPIVEYTARLNNILAFADPVFRDALAWKLAATLAPSLAAVDPYRPEQHGRGPETPQDPTERKRRNFADQQNRVRIAQWAWAMYERTLPQAEVADRNESYPEPNPDAEWIRGRQ